MKQLRHTSPGVKTPSKALIRVPAMLFSFLINFLKTTLFKPFQLSFNRYQTLFFNTKNAPGAEKPSTYHNRLVTKPFLQEKKSLNGLIKTPHLKKHWNIKKLVESPLGMTFNVVKHNFSSYKIQTS